MTTNRRRADVVLVERGYFPSRAKAREAIEAGLVRADGRHVRKPAEDMCDTAAIEAAPAYPWVSRGGLKLEAALDGFGIDPRDRVCVDVGGFYGGFTDVLLARGASRVFSVDVGHGQLHQRLAGDPRVVSLEGLDARQLSREHFGIAGAPSLAVFDVSFISLKLVLPHVLELVAPASWCIALVKPQFEAGREAVRKGIVRDSAVHERVCAETATLVHDLGWCVMGLAPSPVEGSDGNREFLLGARRNPRL